MITLDGQSLVFRFPEVHEDARTAIEFERTLRIPEDGKSYPLPPGLGAFALEHMEDYEACVSRDWSSRGGVMMPLYQAEAMWISFGGSWSESYPCAIKIAAGTINAVSGKPWKPELDGAGNDYVVVPPQPWLDGFYIAKDVIRQFVAMPLGSARAEHGRVQIIVYPMKRERYQAILRQRQEEHREWDETFTETVYDEGRAPVPEDDDDMALAAGGRMTQEIHADPHGIDAWDQSVSSRCFVTLVNAVQWHEITGGTPPTRPPTAGDYSDAGLPWRDAYAADLETLGEALDLTLLKSLGEMAAERGEEPLDPDEELDPDTAAELPPGRPVREARA
jgi:hypothetical protein